MRTSPDREPCPGRVASSGNRAYPVPNAVICTSSGVASAQPNVTEPRLPAADKRSAGEAGTFCLVIRQMRQRDTAPGVQEALADYRKRLCASSELWPLTF